MPSSKNHDHEHEAPWIEKGAVAVSLFLIRLYRVFLSPLLGPGCRFYPSCSAYAEDALRLKGFGRGLLFAARRLLKCQPFHPGGVDVVEAGT